jgi:tRNA modification GTPase
MPFSTADTIVAIATPAGQGGVGIVRLSGPEAWSIAQQIFRRRSKTPIRPQHAYYGAIVDGAGIALDDGLLLCMRGPRSYTGEDVAEINAHGSPVILQRIVGMALRLGARAAEPGEMTLRAFLHGRIDLAQAEAVADMIAANSEAAARQAMRQLAGDLSAQVQAARGAILAALAPIEATIDFPEDEVPIPERNDLLARIAEAETIVAALLAGAGRGRIVRDGARCVIIGRPNVGKSSLLNRLLRADRAIVTPVAGTTRDTIEESAQIGGVAMHLVDTAGLAATDDPIERAGMQRSRAALAEADLALFVLDRSEPFTAHDRQIARELADHGFGRPARPIIVVRNKADLPDALAPRSYRALLAALAPPENVPATIAECTVSLTQDFGVDALEAEMARMILGGPAQESAALVARARHQEALRIARDLLATSAATLRDGFPIELAASDLHEALRALGLITGETITEDLLGSIFSTFCIGK